MEYRSLGRTGVMVSPFCLGSTNFGNPTSAEESIRIIHRALDVGINFLRVEKVDPHVQGTMDDADGLLRARWITKVRRTQTER